MTLAIIEPRQQKKSHDINQKILPWITEDGCIAQFLIPNEPKQTPTSSRFDESSEAFWNIQGEIFHSDNYCPARDIDVINELLKNIDNFTKMFWGKYSILVYEKHQKKFTFLSEPCGQYPVYYATHATGALYFSHVVRDFFRQRDNDPQPDKQYLHQYLINGYGNSIDTGWQDLKLLPPGYAMFKPLSGGLSFSRVWSPVGVFTCRRTASPFELLCKVLKAQLEGENNLFIELSGGVESTAIALAVRDLKIDNPVVTLTYFDPRRSTSNEVEIAQAVARHCCFEHAVYPLLNQLPFMPVTSVPIVARPTTQLCFLAQSGSQAIAGLPVHDSVLLNGHGGDAIFLAPPPFSVPIDAIAKLRLKQALNATYNLAITYRLPLLSILSRSVAAATQFFHGALNYTASPAIAPLPKTRSASGLYDDVLTHYRLMLQPARRYQIAALGATLDETVIQVRPHNKRPVLPFLSQPMVELALQLEPDELFTGYHNRLPIRKSAYNAAKLPNLWRRDKGDTTHSVLLGIQTHYHYIREICLDGYCVTQGMVHPQELDKLIKRAALGYAVGLQEITRVFATELFLQSKPC